jgi:hypothetical protein
MPELLRSELAVGEPGDAIGALQGKKFGHGDIDLIWGYKGIAAPKWEHGYGLVHFLARHLWKEGHLQEMLDRMTHQASHGPERVDLWNSEGEHAVLALTWYGERREPGY